ncbi:MAG: T9SS type A sorting domain-containing protein, partial [Bacteroidetes bacterium]|nr:T9SS type A sorting domain-containing protein [Bacteroidota bacterium]
MRHFYFILLFLYPLACFSQDMITITLNPGITGKTIPPDFAGLSFEKNCLKKGYFNPRFDTLVRLFKTCGIKSLRVGGNSVDTNTLSRDTAGRHYTRAALDSLFLFAQKAGCKIIMGLNLKHSNALSADTEASYVMQYQNSSLFGFEVGNEPDLYPKSKYSYSDYKRDFTSYYNTIRQSNPAAVFTGPDCASNFETFTLPFCGEMGDKISMLTQHYYGGKKDSATISVQIDSLMSMYKLAHVSEEVRRLAGCASSKGIIFRMSECNSIDDGGQKGVSDAFVSALWALDYMYQLASESCAGVNFHGGLDGEYTVFSRDSGIYRARPIAYGILAFQIGSKGSFIYDTVTNKKINLDSYSVIDSSNNIYTTVINKETDTLKKAVINLTVTDTVNSTYYSAEYVKLYSPSLKDTTRVSLGGQVVDSLGNIPAYKWTSLAVTSHQTKIPVNPHSAVVIKFNYKYGNSINDHSENNKHFLNLYPNPASKIVTVNTGMNEHSVISIYNMQGQLLLQQQAKQGKTDIDISELAKGVYILRLYSN